VLAEMPDAGVLRAARGAAAYHGAHLVILLEPGAKPPAEVLPQTTVLEKPDDDAGAFADLVGRYAVRLAAGEDAGAAWQSAVKSVGWEPASAELPEEPEQPEESEEPVG
jgi:hypothetical protein